MTFSAEIVTVQHVRSSLQRVVDLQLSNGGKKLLTFLQDILDELGGYRTLCESLPREDVELFNRAVTNLNNQIPATLKPIQQISLSTLSSDVPVPSAVEFFRTFNGCWNEASKDYVNLPFEEDVFAKQLRGQVAQHFVDYNHDGEYGFIEKKDVERGDKIFVRADLHGDLRSLMENLRTLHAQGHLDENLRCKEGVHLVFLGDYSDRGNHAGQVLQLLAALRAENPGKVTLIRGNHESAETHLFYTNTPGLLRVAERQEALLERFYDTMPLTAYIGVKGDKRQYVQFTHGAFELYVDPQQMLANEEPQARMNISKQRTLSARVQNTAQAKKLREYLGNEALDPDITRYNWGDVDTTTNLGLAGGREWTINGDDIKDVFRASSAAHKVKFMFRGHQHENWATEYQGKKGKKVICKTLTVGMDSPHHAKIFVGQKDTACLLTTDHAVKDWMSVEYRRASFSPVVEITEPVPIRSTEM